MKICVYAICKNEEKFINRWYESMKEADEIYVLDTGSTDNSISLLKKLGVNVKKKKFQNWRFDDARNEAMKLLPSDCDICVSTDLDELFEPGWRKKMEETWTPNTNRMRVNYNWSFDENGTPNISFYYEKIHDRNNYKWINPVHEVLEFKGENEQIITNDEITINHYPDTTKPRSSYLPLLEIAVKENPYNDRNTHYLGREYMYYQKWNQAIDTLINHLALPTATWKDERAASMRFIARSYQNLNRIEEAKMWYQKAIQEAPYLRDGYIEKALLEYKLNNWKEIYDLCIEASKITNHTKTYINEVFSWNETIYDLLSIASFHLQKYDEAIKWINEAININNKDQRLQENKIFFDNYKKEII